jgi:hypothetical protein
MQGLAGDGADKSLYRQSCGDGLDLFCYLDKYLHGCETATRVAHQLQNRVQSGCRSRRNHVA